MDCFKDEVNGAQGHSTSIKRLGITAVCVLFSITITLFVLFGYRVQSREFYSGIIITEFVLISLPALLFLIISRFRLKETLRLNHSRFMNYFVIFWIVIFAIPLASVFNLLNLFIVNKIFEKVIVEPVPVGNNGLELLLSIIVIAGSAAICEEFLFRGVVQRGVEAFGPFRAILMAAFLFSLTHLDFQKILGTFLLGVLIGFIVYRTNSLYCGMFAHFTNNAIAVIVGYISNKLLGVIQKSENMVKPSGNSISDIFKIFSTFSPQQLRIVLLFYGFLFFFFAIVFAMLLFLLIRLNPSRSVLKPLTNGVPAMGEDLDVKTGRISRANAGNGVRGLIWLIPGFLMIGLWFYSQTCGFLKIDNGITEMFKYMIGAAVGK